jgi:hypothetical protein
MLGDGIMARDPDTLELITDRGRFHARVAA